MSSILAFGRYWTAGGELVVCDGGKERGVVWNWG